MEPATATDVCDGISKSKNITVHGNATIIKQTGPKLVYSVEQCRAAESIGIDDNCGRKMLDSATRWQDSVLIGGKVPDSATRWAIKA